jgi:hypothetical protein
VSTAYRSAALEAARFFDFRELQMFKTVYPCSKSRHAPLWRRLSAAEELTIHADWPYWPLNKPDTRPPTAAEWRAHADRCMRQAAAADIALFYAEPQEKHFGALLECGAALSAGKTVYLIAPAAEHEWPFLRNHPRVKSFSTLRGAIDAIAKDQN